MKIAVLGAGITGLVVAHRLRNSADVVVFERSQRAGGNIQTEKIEGCLVEWGPNGFVDNEPATIELVEELGLTSRLVQARSDAAIRYIWRAGQLRKLPTSPPGFLTSDCLPLRARLRALLEPLAKKPPEHEESIHDFAVRHLGKGAAQILVDAMVTGVYAGDPHRLSLRSCFPKLYAMATEHGSLLRGARSSSVGPRGTLTSFDGGLEVLPRELAKHADIRFGSDLETLPSGFDHIICTVPAPRAAALMEPRVVELLQRIPTAPVAVVALIFKRPVPADDAFGFLVPRNQGLRILGTLYDSSIFPNRAATDCRLFRTLIGGRRDPEAVELSDDELLDIALRDLRRAWGSCPEPDHVHIIRHRVGIAQYELGHTRLLEKLRTASPPGLHWTGASYDGVAVNACIRNGRAWTP